MDSVLSVTNLSDNIELISEKFELGLKLNNEDVTGSSKSKGGKKKRKYVPRDDHQAKILRLLGVDLAAIYNVKKHRKGHARVDLPWIEKFSSVDWSEAFNEQGHLRLNRIMPMLPKLVNRQDAHSSLWKAYRRVKVAALGLEHYNRRNEGDQYDLVKSIMAQPALYIRGAYVSHCNFLAKRKNDPGSPVEVFFTEVLYSCDDVVSCSLLEPRLLPPDISFPLEKAKFDRVKVIHPEGVDCLSCKRVTREFL